MPILRRESGDRSAPVLPRILRELQKVQGRTGALLQNREGSGRGMEQKKLIIHGRLPGLNEFIAENRRNYHAGAKLKKEYQWLVEMSAKNCLKNWRPQGPVRMRYQWYEKNKKRDKDNIAAGGRKIIQDALVEAGYLKNDGWNEIVGFSDDFFIDPDDPRIEVDIVPCTKVQTNVFDIVEEHEHCHVQVLKNSITGEISVGWYEEGEYD